MPNLKERILDVVKGPSLAGFATTTKDGKPWVRYVMSEVSDDLSFPVRLVYQRAQDRSDPEQPRGTPNVRRPYLQIQGHAEFTTEPRSPARLLERKAQGPLPGPGRPELWRRHRPSLLTKAFT